MNGKRALVETHVYSENNLFQEYSTVHYSKAVYYTFHDSSYFPWSSAKLIVLHSEDVWSRQNQCLTVPFRLYLIVASMMRARFVFWLQGQCCSLLFLLLRQICALIVFDCCVWDARSFVFECYVRDARSLCVWLLRQWCVLTLPLWCALSLFVLNCCISDAYGLWSDTRNCCFPLQCRGQFLSLSEALLFVLKGQSSSPVTNNSRHE